MVLNHPGAVNPWIITNKDEKARMILALIFVTEINEVDEINQMITAEIAALDGQLHQFTDINAGTCIHSLLPCLS